MLHILLIFLQVVSNASVARSVIKGHCRVGYSWNKWHGSICYGKKKGEKKRIYPVDNITATGKLKNKR